MPPNEWETTELKGTSPLIHIRSRSAGADAKVYAEVTGLPRWLLWVLIKLGLRIHLRVLMSTSTFPPEESP